VSVKKYLATISELCLFHVSIPHHQVRGLDLSGQKSLLGKKLRQIRAILFISEASWGYLSPPSSTALDRRHTGSYNMVMVAQEAVPLG